MRTMVTRGVLAALCVASLMTLSAGGQAPKDAGISFISTTIEFSTDEDLPVAGLGAGPWGLGQLAANGFDAMGVRDTRGAQVPALLAGPGEGNAAMRHVAWQATGNTKYLEDLYTDQARATLLREYINTQGSLRIDRVNMPDAEPQRARLGGIALVRNDVFPGHVVSWEFAEADAGERVVILAPKTADVVLTVPAKANPRGASVTVEMRGPIPEITLRSNVVKGVF